jgi:hypothetical protein
MKNIFLLLFPAVLLMSCGNSKKTIENTSNTPEVVTETLYVGVVELDEKCGPIIKVESENTTQTFAPSNFDERYKKAGMRVRFGTEDNLAKVPKCSDHLIVKVTRMTPLR